jgi:TPR/MLP1/MLP2-like protein
LAHAESIKAIAALKQKLSSAQTAYRDNLAAAETAQANLATSESSWKQQKETLTKELADVNARLIISPHSVWSLLTVTTYKGVRILLLRTPSLSSISRM